MIECLSASDTIAVALAAEALGDLGDSAAVPQLQPLLNHRSTLVRGEAARALVRLGETDVPDRMDESAPPVLKTMLRRAAAERVSGAD